MNKARSISRGMFLSTNIHSASSVPDPSLDTRKGVESVLIHLPFRFGGRTTHCWGCHGRTTYCWDSRGSPGPRGHTSAWASPRHGLAPARGWKCMSLLVGGREHLRGPFLVLLHLNNNAARQLSITLLLLLLLLLFRGCSILATLWVLAPFSALGRGLRESHLRGFGRRDMAKPAVSAILASATLRKLEA